MSTVPEHRQMHFNDQKWLVKNIYIYIYTTMGKKSLMKKASHCRHSCLMFYWAMFVSWYSCVFYFQISFPSYKSILLCVDAGYSYTH